MLARDYNARIWSTVLNFLTTYKQKVAIILSGTIRFEMSHTLVIRSSRLASNHLTTAAFLSPLLSQFQQCRHASILTSLKNTDASYNKRIRRGRGPASGKGKTSGRGHKGQKQHGKVPAGFNGGQTPDEVVAGKRGFENT